MRRAWVFVCLVLLAACSNKVKESAVALTITYPKPGYVPACIRVTALDAAAENLKSSELIDSATLARHAEDRTLVLAVYREKGWSQQLQVEVSSYSTEKCEGQAIETRRLAEAVTLPEKGAVPAALVLKAQDADKDGHPASSMEDKAINGTDCNDGRADVYKGASSKCSVQDAEVDFDCDEIKECRPQANGSTCLFPTMCASGHCVDGICCDTACDSPSQCGGVGSCGTGKCAYQVLVGKACTDNNNCTTGDKCTEDGACKGTDVTCNSPTSSCYETMGRCDSASGACIYTPKSATVDCDDKNACTLIDKCDGNGACVGSAPKSCNTPTGQCYESPGTCDPSSGACSYPPKPTTATCNDDQFCTRDDRCDGAGGCAGTAYTCAPPNACQIQAEVCTGDGNCVYTVNPAMLGKPCTWSTTTNQQGTCVASVNGKCSLFPYSPSNFDPDALTPAEVAGLQEVRVSCDVTLDTSGSGPFVWSATNTCTTLPVAPLAKVMPQLGGGPEVLVLYMKRLDIDYEKTVTVKGTRPVIFAIYELAYIHGSILANATKAQPGAGGNAMTCDVRAGGAGTNGGGSGGGGGGGFATAGAVGGTGDGNSAAGTAGAQFESTLVPLIGGCPGGAGGTNAVAGVGGAGGGAVQISAAGLLNVDGTVSVSGGGGKGGGQTDTSAGGGGGGGSGGGILLEGRVLEVLGIARLTANGGAGGEGGFEGSNVGADGSDGSTNSASAALPGTSTSSQGGDGGSGGVAGVAPTAGSNGGKQGNESGGGGGGGGATGVIRLRAGGTSSCNISGAAVISPVATRVCP
ncbi:hypothetical protein [Archangium lipolyticum]|uniref:hypothetical protein n=1 Tax=Archangium lipolyticum TaxID=2970465 RepID=UPI002149EC96|nr:hypothetical protein [Archangium lipolyticum]